MSFSLSLSLLKFCKAVYFSLELSLSDEILICHFIFLNAVLSLLLSDEVLQGFLPLSLVFSRCLSQVKFWKIFTFLSCPVSVSHSLSLRCPAKLFFSLFVCVKFCKVLSLSRPVFVFPSLFSLSLLLSLPLSLARTLHHYPGNHLTNKPVISYLKIHTHSTSSYNHTSNNTHSWLTAVPILPTVVKTCSSASWASPDPRKGALWSVSYILR